LNDSSLSSSLNESIENKIGGLINDENLESSFLKQMLIETNKHYIKDQMNNEDKLKNSCAHVINNTILMNIYNKKLYCFLMIKFYKKKVFKNKGNIIFKCYEKFRNKIKNNILLKYFNRFKIICINSKPKVERIIELIESLEINNGNINEARNINKYILNKITQFIMKNKKQEDKKTNDNINNKNNIDNNNNSNKENENEDKKFDMSMLGIPLSVTN